MNDEVAPCLNEGSSLREKEVTKSSQDISQISGPSGQSKPTPLSQMGFRDPASVGAGQQLTLLSVEVRYARYFSTVLQMVMCFLNLSDKMLHICSCSFFFSGQTCLF